MDFIACAIGVGIVCIAIVYKEFKVIGIELIENQIRKNERLIERLLSTYYAAFSPEEYPTGTSYLDADTIHGTRKELHIEYLPDEINRIREMIEVDKIILNSLKRKVNIEVKLSELDNVQDKVKFLRRVMKLNQKGTAEILGMSERQIRRIDKKIKMSC